MYIHIIYIYNIVIYVYTYTYNHIYMYISKGGMRTTSVRGLFEKEKALKKPTKNQMNLT